MCSTSRQLQLRQHPRHERAPQLRLGQLRGECLPLLDHALHLTSQSQFSGVCEGAMNAPCSCDLGSSMRHSSPFFTTPCISQQGCDYTLWVKECSCDPGSLEGSAFFTASAYFAAELRLHFACGQATGTSSCDLLSFRGNAFPFSTTPYMMQWDCGCRLCFGTWPSQSRCGFVCL